MKTVYVNKSMVDKVLKEGVLLKSLPLDILRSIDANRTSLGNNPSFPEVFNMPFMTKITNEYFEKTKDKLKEIGTIDDVECTDLKSCLSALIEKCKDIERPYRNELEKICFNHVIDLFEVPDDAIQLSISLVEAVDLGKKSIILDPSEENGEIENVKHALEIKDEVYKRKLLNAIIMGASIKMSSSIDTYKEEIDKINPKLCDLYNKIIALNNYLLFTADDIGMTEENKMQIGTVEVSFGHDSEKVKIESQGIIFPILLSETIRGFMELFISHGLPKDRNTAEIVIGKSDFLKSEPWNMRTGPILWELLSSNFNDISTTEIPYIMKRISKLKTKKFNFLMKEIFAKTNKGKRIIDFIVGKSLSDSEYDKFADKMSKMNNNNGIITDEYIHANEL